MAEREYPQVEYHFEVIAPGGAHHDVVAAMPFPTVSVGDLLHFDLSMTDYSIGVPKENALRITRVFHHITDYPAKAVVWHTTVWTELAPRP